MSNQSNRRWLVAAGAVLTAMIAIWVLLVFQLKPAAAGGSRISLSLRSRLAADYSADDGQSLGSLSLSIVSDMMEDLGMGRLVAAEYSDEMRVAMLTPVPTATALNFEGELPPTITPTRTPVPTDTPSNTPEPTVTNTRQPAATNTPKPTDKPKPVTTSTSCSDCKYPEIRDASVSPNSGSFSTCDFEVTLSDFHIVDPDFSSGMSFVGIKYKFDGGSYYYHEMSKISGGFTDNTWDAVYGGGTITIRKSNSILSVLVMGKALAKLNSSRNFTETDTPTPTATATATTEPPTATPEPPTPVPPTNTPPPTFNVTLWAKASDNAGHTVYERLGSFSCTE